MSILNSLNKSKTKDKNHHLQQGQERKILITVTVMGSAGSLRFIVKEQELVSSVICTVLRSYARQGRLPVLGFDLNNFQLYCTNAGSDELSSWETIGSNGCRNFLLCKKQSIEKVSSGVRRMRWKSWLNGKITCH